MTYLLRTTPPSWLSRADIDALDDVLRSGVQNIIGILPPEALDTALRPARAGGLGIILPSVASPAWFCDGAASVAEQVRDVTGDRAFLPIGLKEALVDFPAIVQNGPAHFARIVANPAAPVSAPRFANTLRACYAAMPRLGAAGSRQDRLARASSGAPRCWLKAPRVGDPPIHLGPAEFVALFEPNESGDVICRRCGQVADAFGDHAVACRFGGERNRRHTQLRDAVGSLVAAGGCSWRPEVAVPSPGDPLRPADLLVSGWVGGPLAVDVTVAHPLAPSMAAADTAASTAMSRAEARKKVKYDSRCKAAGWEFTPFAVSAFGQLGPHATAFSALMAKRIAARLACPLADASRLVDAVIGGAIAAAVAAQLVSHAPVPELPDQLLPETERAAPTPGDALFNASPPLTAAVVLQASAPAPTACAGAPSSDMLTDADAPAPTPLHLAPMVDVLEDSDVPTAGKRSRRASPTFAETAGAEAQERFTVARNRFI